MTTISLDLALTPDLKEIITGTTVWNPMVNDVLHTAVLNMRQSALKGQAVNLQSIGLQIAEPPLVSEVLREALAILQDNGWFQGGYTNDAGEHCSVGAVMAAMRQINGDGKIDWGNVQVRAYRYLAETIQRHAYSMDAARVARTSGDPGNQVINFNDHKFTTKTDVIDMFEHAIKAAEEDEAE